MGLKSGSAEACPECAIGSYGDARGLSSCIFCIRGQKTLTVGSKNNSQCGCQKDWFMPAGNSPCQLCSINMDCPFGSAEANVGVSVCRDDKNCVFPRVKLGVYTKSSAPMKPYQCFSNPEARPGIWPETCSQDRSGVLCLTCPAAHYRSGDSCTACSTQIPLLILLCIVFAVVFCAAHKTLNTPLTAKVSVGNVGSFVFSVVFTSLQLIGLFSSLDFDFSGGNSDFTQFFTIFMLSPGALRLECITPTSFGQYLVQALFLPVVCLVVFSWFLISRMHPRLRVDGHKLLNTLLSLNQAFLITFANLSILAFNCYEHFEGVSTLYQYPQIFCNETEHSHFIALSGWMVLTAILPFNVFFLFAIWKMYACNKDVSVSMRETIKFKVFFQKWRAERWYWGYVFTWRQMLFACVFSISSDPFTQLFMVIVVLNVYNVLLAALCPWRLFELNCLEFALNILLVFLVMSQIPELDSHSNASNFRNVSFVLLIIYFCILCVCRLRVCLAFASAGSPNKKFNHYPRSVGNDALQVCFENFSKINFSPQFCSYLTQHEVGIVVSFFQLVEKETFSEFGFPVGVGARMCVPNENVCDATSRQKLIEEMRARKSTETESYI